MFNPIHLCLDSNSFLHWFNLIWSSSMIRSNYFLLTRLHWVQSYNLVQLISILRFKRIGFHSLFRINFNYLASDVLPFTFHLEDGEILSQLCSNEHDWFIPDLIQNTRGRWCPNIPGCYNYSVSPIVNCDSTGITLSALCTEVNTICIWPYVQFQRATLPPIFRSILTSYGYHM